MTKKNETAVAVAATLMGEKREKKEEIIYQNVWLKEHFIVARAVCMWEKKKECKRRLET